MRPLTLVAKRTPSTCVEIPADGQLTIGGLVRRASLPAAVLELLRMEISSGGPQSVVIRTTQRSVVARALVAKPAPRMEDVIAAHVLQALQRELGP